MDFQPYVHSSGMLRVDRPRKWKVREYPTDPRAKVEFWDPADRGVTVRLIATPAEGATLAEVLPDFEERSMQMRALGAQVALADAIIRGVNAKRLTIRHTGIEQVLYLFVDADMYCNFSFDCSILGENGSISGRAGILRRVRKRCCAGFDKRKS